MVVGSKLRRRGRVQATCSGRMQPSSPSLSPSSCCTVLTVSNQAVPYKRRRAGEYGIGGNGPQPRESKFQNAWLNWPSNGDFCWIKSHPPRYCSPTFTGVLSDPFNASPSLYRTWLQLHIHNLARRTAPKA